MSNEKGQFNSEKNFENESLAEAGKAEQERIGHDKERNNAEKGHDKETNESDARKEALELANSSEKESKQTEKADDHSPLERHGPTKRDKKLSYDSTMKEVRSHMSGPSRTFSKLIHAPLVEKVSDATGSTVARPNAILSGAVFAFLLTLGLYLIARMNGYPLTGTESIAAFALGWVLGLIYDFFKVMIVGKR